MYVENKHCLNSTNHSISSKYKITPKPIVRKSIKMSKQTHFPVTERYNGCYNGRCVLFTYACALFRHREEFRSSPQANRETTWRSLNNFLKDCHTPRKMLCIFLWVRNDGAVRNYSVHLYQSTPYISSYLPGNPQKKDSLNVRYEPICASANIA